MGRVAGVFDNPPGFPCTPPGVDILEGGKLTSNNVAGSSHDPLQSPAVASGAVSKPGGDGAGQDALHNAGVEGPEDSGARSKLPQPSQEEETLMCLLQHCICVSRPCSSSSSPLLSLVQVPAKLAINLSIHTQHTYDNGVDRTGDRVFRKIQLLHEEREEKKKKI